MEYALYSCDRPAVVILIIHSGIAQNMHKRYMTEDVGNALQRMHHDNTKKNQTTRSSCTCKLSDISGH